MNEFLSKILSTSATFIFPSGVELTCNCFPLTTFLTRLSFTKYFPDSWSTLIEISVNGLQACRFTEKLTRKTKIATPKKAFKIIHLTFIEPIFYRFNQSVYISRPDRNQHIKIF